MVLLKWAGSKSSSRNFIIEKINYVDRNYFEPFIGGGSIAFGLLEKQRIHGKSFLSDIDVDLMNFWKVVQESPSDLVHHIELMVETGYYSEETYYEIRRIFNAFNGKSMKKEQSIGRAGMIYFLNHQGFNGLWRRNSKGLYNVPVGSNSGIDVQKMRTDVRWYSRLLSEVSFLVSDFRDAMSGASRGDVVYIDPPYYSKTGKNFTQYNGEVFKKEDMDDLFDLSVRLSGKGVRVFVSAPGYYPVSRNMRSSLKMVHETTVRRAINSDASNRGAVKERLLEFEQNGSG